MVEFECTWCGKKYPVDTLEYKCECGGLFKLNYDKPEFTKDLIDESEWNIFRYKKFMPFETESFKSVTLGEGLSPIVEYDENLLMKMDYMMPTLSFKDRGAAALLTHCKDIGVKSVVQDSSGNAGNSVAAYAAKLGIECEIFVPENTSPKKINMIEAHGATCHVIKGNRDHCADECRKYVKESGKYYANHVYNPYFYEGTKTYIYEIYEELGYMPENIFLPLGNGTLFIGSILALEHLLDSKIIDKIPNIVAIQSEKCAPFAKAKSEKLDRIPDIIPEDTLAEGIAIGKPMRDKEILEYIYKYDIDIVEIPEKDILPARKKLALKGAYVEHTTAGNLAAYEKYKRENDIKGRSIITLCGAGLKSNH